MHYLSLTPQDEKEMLQKIGVNSFDELVKKIIPEELHCGSKIGLPEASSEQEIRKIFKELGQINVTAEEYVSFLGGGIYDHYIPAVINQILLRSEFYTAYTPYQAEVSQGTLQSIFEYQTAVCELTKMAVANASMYDGASALAEACIMAKAVTKRNKVLIAESINPLYQRVIRTYLAGTDTQLETMSLTQGSIDLNDLERKVDDSTACVAIQHPNFFGILEEITEIEKIGHRTGALFVVCVDPISLGILVPPGDYSADIVVGEGQGLGLPMSLGGPLLGFFATRKDFIRFIPGRIVGLTTDIDGQRGFVLTLQTREQHIRRDKATSNICTNEALCALAALIYLTLMGSDGLKEVAEQSLCKSHYLKEQLVLLPGIKIPYNKPFFKEFVIEVDEPKKLLDALLTKKIFGGVHLGRFDNRWQKYILIAVTEKRTREEMDYFVESLKTAI